MEQKKDKLHRKIGMYLAGALAIFLIVVFGVLAWQKKQTQAPKPETSQQTELTDVTPQSPESKNDFSISDQWTSVSHENFWNNPKKIKNPDPNRFPYIEFYYPENWEFSCCGDMGHASNNYIRPPGRDNSLPYIRITNYVLSGCPDPKISCSLDKTISLSATEKFNRLKSEVPNNQILPETNLKNLNINAFTYKKTGKDSKLSKSYLMNLDGSVIEVDFVNYELLDEKFIESFLNRIEFESR